MKRKLTESEKKMLDFAKENNLKINVNDREEITLGSFGNDMDLPKDPEEVQYKDEVDMEDEDARGNDWYDHDLYVEYGIKVNKDSVQSPSEEELYITNEYREKYGRETQDDFTSRMKELTSPGSKYYREPSTDEKDNRNFYASQGLYDDWGEEGPDWNRDPEGGDIAGYGLDRLYDSWHEDYKGFMDKYDWPKQSEYDEEIQMMMGDFYSVNEIMGEDAWEGKDNKQINTILRSYQKAKDKAYENSDEMEPDNDYIWADILAGTDSNQTDEDMIIEMYEKYEYEAKKLREENKKKRLR